MMAKSAGTGGIGTRFSPHLSREKGTVIKDWGGRLPVALVYPNTYYLGMSNLGIHTIYRLLNNHRDIVCERVFFENDFRNPPLSVESNRPLTDFAVIAFSVSYELDFFNIVSVLRAAGIPLHATDRDERHPLVIAGGPCITSNPMPLYPFFDCFCIGEAEPVLPPMLPYLLEGIGGQRGGLLKALSLIPGILVPAVPSENSIARQWAKNLDDFPATSAILTPDTELGKLYLVEAERGCQRGCRFCLVNSTFSPMRFGSVASFLEQAGQGLDHGKRIGLVGPAVGDHPQLEELLSGLLKMGAQFSISSLRVNALSREILKSLMQGKAETITIAPEAGSERLRRVINKGISNDDIMKAADMIAAEGFGQLKLYFMLGLPTETDDDIQDIIRLVLAMKNTIEKRRGMTRITLNIAPFVPKANTPFQWLPMAPLSVLNRRISVLKKALPQKGITVKAESPAWSLVQGVLARSDRRVADILLDIEEVSLSGWRRAIEKHDYNIDDYVHRRWDIDRELPWGMIDSGVKPLRLKQELEKASV